MSTATATAPGAIDQETHHKNAWVKVLPVIGIVLIVVYCLAPFYWMVVSSLRPDNEIFDNTWWPAHPSLENYQAVFQPNNNFLRGLGNSLIVSISVTIIALLIATFASYALARLDFRGKGGFLILIIATSMFPLVAIIVPLLKNFSAWHWINTYQAMIIPDLSFSLPLAVWNLTTFFKQMPDDRWLLPRPSIPQDHPAAGCPRHLHHGDHRLHRCVERVPRRRHDDQRPEDGTCHGAAVEVHRCFPVQHPVRFPDGRRCHHDGAAGHHGAGLPAPDRRRAGCRWSQVMPAGQHSSAPVHDGPGPN